MAFFIEITYHSINEDDYIDAQLIFVLPPDSETQGVIERLSNRVYCMGGTLTVRTADEVERERIMERWKRKWDWLNSDEWPSFQSEHS